MFSNYCVFIVFLFIIKKRTFHIIVTCYYTTESKPGKYLNSNVSLHERYNNVFTIFYSLQTTVSESKFVDINVSYIS